MSVDAADRLQPAQDIVRIPGLRRVHCSYHKCLTVYFKKVMDRTCRSPLGPGGGYRHFNSRIDDFYRECADYTIASVNNHVLDLDRFEDVRVTRFIRDPRDLIVSGYFYHKRSAEPWCDVVDPSERGWLDVPGQLPAELLRGRSFAQYLNEVDVEDGLLAELGFRRRHFESMRHWKADDPRIEVFRYEEILGHEKETFDRIFRFYELPFRVRRVGIHYARKFCAAVRSDRSQHIRDARAGQWRRTFTPKVVKTFNDEFGDLLELLDYPLD
jgi:hypothetical protein